MMKRFLAVLLILLLSVSAAWAEGELRGYTEGEGYVYVLFGSYTQEIDGGIPDDGDQAMKWRKMHQDYKSKNKGKDFDPGVVEKTPILWRVLSVDEEKAYLLSEFILFSMPMHKNLKEYGQIRDDFTKTELSQELNGPFASEAFTEAEAAMLLDLPGLGKVFIPSSTELSDPALGFAAKANKTIRIKDESKKLNTTRRTWATEYAVRVTHTFVYATSWGNHSPYWLRDVCTIKGSKPSQAYCTKQDGSIGYYSSSNYDEGVRPAVYLAAGAYRLESGSGTREDPFVAVPAPGADVQP